MAAGAPARRIGASSADAAAARLRRIAQSTPARPVFVQRPGRDAAFVRCPGSWRRPSFKARVARPAHRSAPGGAAVASSSARGADTVGSRCASAKGTGPEVGPSADESRRAPGRRGGVSAMRVSGVGSAPSGSSRSGSKVVPACSASASPGSRRRSAAIAISARCGQCDDAVAPWTSRSWRTNSLAGHGARGQPTADAAELGQITPQHRRQAGNRSASRARRLRWPRRLSSRRAGRATGTRRPSGAAAATARQDRPRAGARTRRRSGQALEPGRQRGRAGQPPRRRPRQADVVGLEVEVDEAERCRRRYGQWRASDRSRRSPRTLRRRVAASERRGHTARPWRRRRVCGAPGRWRRRAGSPAAAAARRHAASRRGRATRARSGPEVSARRQREALGVAPLLARPARCESLDVGAVTICWRPSRIRDRSPRRHPIPRPWRRGQSRDRRSMRVRRAKAPASSIRRAFSAAAGADSSAGVQRLPPMPGRGRAAGSPQRRRARSASAPGSAPRAGAVEHAARATGTTSSRARASGMTTPTRGSAARACRRDRRAPAPAFERRRGASTAAGIAGHRWPAKVKALERRGRATRRRRRTRARRGRE